MALVHGDIGKCADIVSTRSSQYGIAMEIPLLLVAEVRCFFGRPVELVDTLEVEQSQPCPAPRDRFRSRRGRVRRRGICAAE